MRPTRPGSRLVRPEGVILPRRITSLMDKLGLTVTADLDPAAAGRLCLERIEGLPAVPVTAKRLVVVHYGLEDDIRPAIASAATARGMTKDGLWSSLRKAVNRVEAAATQKRLSAAALIGSPETDQQLRQSVERLAAVIPRDIWLSDRRLRITAERGLDLLSPQRARIIILRYGFYGERQTNMQIMAGLSISKFGLEDARAMAYKKLDLILPALAAGTYDYASTGTAANQRSVVRFMTRAGFAVARDKNLAALRLTTLNQLDSMTSNGVISPTDKQICTDYYRLAIDLESGAEGPSVATIASSYGYSMGSLLYHLSIIRHKLLRASAMPDGDETHNPPLIGPPALRAILREHGLPEPA